MARVGRPLNLKFKALDGREVDVQQMTGKVVLVDFWATWCGPCMAELPKVKAAYDKLHSRGFEILGISFDQDQAALERVLVREKITWPQHFEEGGSGSKFGEEFEIGGIPTLWLVDKKGNLRELNARENLAEKVEKLLAEK
jgi:thiol-disulfide isomerase/thioredoxin